MTAYFIEEGSAMNKWKMILTALITTCAIVPQTAAYHLRGTPIMRYDSPKLLSGALSNLKEAKPPYHSGSGSYGKGIWSAP